jgi:hypothetical protein
MRASFFSPYPFYYSFFRRRSDGDWDVFPYLRWGRGYRVNAMQRADLIDSMLRYDLGIGVCFAIVLAGASLALTKMDGFNSGTGRTGIADVLMSVLFLGSIGLFAFLRFRNLRRLVKNLPPAETALTAAGEYALWAAQLPKAVILAVASLGSFGCIATVAGTWHVLRSGDWLAVPLLMFTAAGFDVIAWYYAQTWRHRVK